ncbi:13159_t:CDS:2, partial [Gigaspora rosea]
MSKRPKLEIELVSLGQIDDKDLLNSSFEGIEFRPFAFKVEKYLVQIGEYNKKCALFVQTVEPNYLCQVAIYQFNHDPILILGTNPNNVWENVGIFKKFRGTQLFGLENSLTQKKIATQKIPKCTPISWNNYNNRIKRSITTHNHLFNERELRAWHAMLKSNIDSKTGQPLKYLKDQKKTLWQKYFELYPTGMKRTTFMTRLRNSPYAYRDDLGGLCYTCNEYGYSVFEELKELVKKKVENRNNQ